MPAEEVELHSTCPDKMRLKNGKSFHFPDRTRRTPQNAPSNEPFIVRPILSLAGKCKGIHVVYFCAENFFESVKRFRFS